jgi:bifunctional pyridoxal-dependent enzyme with beta-cystathionase and maltose regulon repressor activities
VEDLRLGMTDDEVVAHYRRLRPHINATTARATYRAWCQFRHLGVAAELKEQEAAEAESSRLRQRLFGQNLEHADEVAE